jgi:hypothetical protein
MLDTLLEAADDRHDVFVRDVVSLVIAGLGQRGRASARVSAGRTIADAAKVASIVYACMWLTAGLTASIDGRGWHQDSPDSLYAVGLLVVLLAWLRGRERLAGMIGVACTVVLLVAHPPYLTAAIAQPIVPASGYLIMSIAPTRKRPTTVGVAALAALVALGVILSPANAHGISPFIMLASASIAGLLVFVVQPQLAIAVAIIWTAIGIELIAFAGTQPAPLWLLVAAAPGALAATAARAQMIRRRAT